MNENFENQNVYENNQAYGNVPPESPNPQSYVSQDAQQYSQQMPNQYVAPVENYEENGRGFAIASLVLGIVSFFCCGAICSIIGIILGCVSRSKQKEKNAMATAGIVLSIISLAFWAVYIILCAVGVITFPYTGTYYY